MFAKTENPVEAWTAPATEAFDFWISLWPTAPLFGVQWRFADVVAEANPFISVAIKSGGFPTETKVAAKPRAKAKVVAKVIPAAKAEVVAESKSAAKVAKVAKVEPIAKVKPVIEAKPAVEIKPAAKVEPVVEVKPETAVEPAVAVKVEPVTGKPASLMAKAPRNADDLTSIKGIGPGIAQQLNALGIYKFAQIADLSEAELTWVDDNLTSLKGRCFRDNWIDQAKTLRG